MRLDYLTRRFASAAQRQLGTADRRLAAAASKLDALSPLKVLSRGYAMVTRENAVIRETAQIHPGDAITVSLSDGTAQCTVNTVQRRNKRGKKADI